MSRSRSKGKVASEVLRVVGPEAWPLGREIAHAACHSDHGGSNDVVHFWRSRSISSSDDMVNGTSGWLFML